MTKDSSPRRTPDQWQEFVDQWQGSGLTARQFCTEHNLGYASFCKWRQRLTQAEHDPSSSPRADFIDLGTFTAPANSPGWTVTLSLGGGVEIRLSQS